MKLMIALKPHRYAGKLMSRGDVFRVRGASDQRLLKALGWAEDHIVPAPVAAVFAPPVVEEFVAHLVEQVDEDEQPAEPEAPPVELSLRTGKPKRQYKRRDMTAED